MTKAISIQYDDMLDIIFEHKNKAYGAYQLRRAYNNHLAKAFGAGISLLVLFSFVVHTGQIRRSKAHLYLDAPTEFTPPDLVLEPPAPPVVPPTPPPPSKPTVQFVPPIITDDEHTPDKLQDPNELIMEDPGEIGAVTKAGDPDAMPGGLGGEVPAELDYVESTPPPPDTYSPVDVQKMPSFPGGDGELMKFLRDNISYPMLAKENNIQGTAAIQFVVGKDGQIKEVMVLRDPGGGCGKEAVRVVGLMPKWTPGEANGVPVRVRFTLPVRFKLQ